MKIKINKLLTLCMVLFVLFTSAIPAMAQETATTAAGPKGTITYHTGKQDVNGVEFKVYRIMDATTATEQGGSNDLVAYTFNADFKAFLESEISKDDQLTGETNELKAQEYLNKNVTKPEFQSSLKNEITTKQIAPVSTFTGVTGTTSYPCNDLPYGYYVIIPSNEKISLSFTTLYEPALDVYSKGLKPGVDKTIDDNKDKDSAQIGDEVNFTVKSTVPNMTGFDKYTFKLVDTLSEGLTFVDGTIANGKFSVQVGDVVLTDNDIIVTKPDALNGNVLTIEIKDFIIKYKNQANKEIVFKYSAILNDKATIDGSGNTNTANVQYGNNPDKLEESSKDVVTVYTHKLTINKKDDGKPAKPLAGAEFQIFKKTPDGQKGEIVKFIKDPMNEGVYRVATKAEIDAIPTTENLVDTVVSPTSGTIVINGLDTASYLIYETKAPDGYNKLKQPIDVTINFDGAQVTNPSLDIINKKGTLLPETGGMGTLMFTVVGVVGILAVAYSFKPKKSKSE